MKKTKKRKRDYKAEYAKRPRWSRVTAWYKSEDKRRGRENDLTSSQVRILISLPCFYCGKEKAGGLDRKDSALGNLEKNCIPSCYECNMILSTLPWPAKKRLAPALRDLHRSGLLEGWSPPNPFIEK